MSKHGSKRVFSLEVERDHGKIKISAYTKSSDDEKTVRQYETKDISDDEIGRMCSTVVHLLNRANRRGKLDRNTLEELQTIGQLFYDSLLTAHVKKKLAATKSENLILIVDDHLVHIPWELLFDGHSFLCRKFNMGRLVRTSQWISTSSARKLQKPLKMLIIADPRNDLEAAYQEGISLRNELDNNLKTIEVNLRSSYVDATSVKGALRHYDILHYAGHADYNMKTPSDSGFLMENGIFTASDIMSMIGPAPLPSLVFSNACKSGHTEKWRVGEDYETEIYGLANAFLLAGVQHYIGTFWDVQDEPSLHFASVFYKELIKGSMVGEAVKKARSGLIERYGEDTIIWASYMLYGDPTAGYVDLSTAGETDKRVEHQERSGPGIEDEEEMAGNIRGANTEIVFPRKKQKWMLTAFVLLAIVAAFAIGTVFKTEIKPSRPEIYKISRDAEKETRKKRIDELVAALINDYRENQKTGKDTSMTASESGLPTLVFLNIKTNGIAEKDREYIMTGIIRILRNSKRVHVVEREILDKLLEELRLSSSELADPAKVLEVGKILSAQIISTGSISNDNRDWQCSLRLIDTETTTIRAALTSILKTVDKEQVADRLGREILDKIRTEYPLQGKILSFEEDKVVINLGRNKGVSLNVKMNVLSVTEGARTKIGMIEVISVNENTSSAKVIARHGEFNVGLKVKEFL
jgi:CHAT domain-containing protein